LPEPQEPQDETTDDTTGEPRTTDTGIMNDRRYRSHKQQPMEPQATDTGEAMNDRRYRRSPHRSNRYWSHKRQEIY